MRFFDEKNIARLSFFYAVILVAVMTFATGGLFIGKKFETMNKDLVEMEQAFISEQKDKLRSDVSLLLAKIDYQRKYRHSLLVKRLQARVMEASEMAENIYKSMQGQRSEEEIGATIMEAIRPLRFYEDQGYFFILTRAGEVLLYPADRTLEGTSFITNRVAGGPEVIRDIIRTGTENGQGIYRYKWSKPDGEPGRLYEKISYVSLFKPLDWIIGTGEYTEDLDALARREITQELEASFNLDTTDYFFIYDLHNVEGGNEFATMLLNSNRPDLIGKKLSDDYVDAKGKEFRKEFLKGIREDGEAHVVYWYKKPDDSGIGRKMSYFKYYPEWHWIVARGIYFDKIDLIIADSKAAMKQKVTGDIILLCVVFLIAVSCALCVAYVYARDLQAIFDRYRYTQEENLAKLEGLNKELEEKGRTDALTGVFNRGYFNDQFIRETSRAKRYKTPLSIILFDIDHFKEINDTYGHLAGDAVLKELATLVRENIRLSDLLIRWGGEEFAILAPGVDCAETVRFARKLLELIAHQSFSVDRQITCSFGVSCYDPDEESETFLQRVDDALYRAKQSGRNRCIAA